MLARLGLESKNAEVKNALTLALQTGTFCSHLYALSQSDDHGEAEEHLDALIHSSTALYNATYPNQQQDAKQLSAVMHGSSDLLKLCQGLQTIKQTLAFDFNVDTLKKDLKTLCEKNNVTLFSAFLEPKSSQVSTFVKLIGSSSDLAAINSQKQMNTYLQRGVTAYNLMKALPTAIEMLGPLQNTVKMISSQGGAIQSMTEAFQSWLALPANEWSDESYLIRSQLLHHLLAFLVDKNELTGQETIACQEELNDLILNGIKDVFKGFEEALNSGIEFSFKRITDPFNIAGFLSKGAEKHAGQFLAATGFTQQALQDSISLALGGAVVPIILKNLTQETMGQTAGHMFDGIYAAIKTELELKGNQEALCAALKKTTRHFLLNPAEYAKFDGEPLPLTAAGLEIGRIGKSIYKGEPDSLEERKRERGPTTVFGYGAAAAKEILKATLPPFIVNGAAKGKDIVITKIADVTGITEAQKRAQEKQAELIEKARAQFENWNDAALALSQAPKTSLTIEVVGEEKNASLPAAVVIPIKESLKPVAAAQPQFISPPPSSPAAVPQAASQSENKDAVPLNVVQVVEAKKDAPQPQPEEDKENNIIIPPAAESDQVVITIKESPEPVAAAQPQFISPPPSSPAAVPQAASQSGNKDDVLPKGEEKEIKLDAPPPKEENANDNIIPPAVVPDQVVITIKESPKPAAANPDQHELIPPPSPVAVQQQPNPSELKRIADEQEGKSAEALKLADELKKAVAERKRKQTESMDNLIALFPSWSAATQEEIRKTILDEIINQENLTNEAIEATIEKVSWHIIFLNDFKNIRSSAATKGAIVGAIIVGGLILAALLVGTVIPPVGIIIAATLSYALLGGMIGSLIGGKIVESAARKNSYTFCCMRLFKKSPALTTFQDEIVASRNSPASVSSG